MVYNKYNFHKHTFCIFKEMSLDAISDLKLSYKSKSGSAYYFTENGVYRYSNHWGRAANCRWRLEPILIVSNIGKSENQKIQTSKDKLGYANWTDFLPNNDHENLFYIAVELENKSVSFQHKATLLPSENAVVRNALATAKRIQTIKEILLEDKWSKYLKFDDIEEIREQIITDLVTTNDTFLKIKQKYR